jgi:hypothetical protein
VCVCIIHGRDMEHVTMENAVLRKQTAHLLVCMNACMYLCMYFT